MMCRGKYLKLNRGILGIKNTHNRPSKMYFVFLYNMQLTKGKAHTMEYNLMAMAYQLIYMWVHGLKNGSTKAGGHIFGMITVFMQDNGKVGNIMGMAC